MLEGLQNSRTPAMARQGRGRALRPHQPGALEPLSLVASAAGDIVQCMRAGILEPLSSVALVAGYAVQCMAEFVPVAG